MDLDGFVGGFQGAKHFFFAHFLAFAFVNAAMALANVGDVSDKIAGESYGYYIIKYVSDAPAGAIALDDVRESISSTLLTKKQTEAFDNAVASWVAESNFKVDMNALK